ncbi:MAG TPA: carboxypeptidase regulatory-like domain-containing protein [Candidatus Didemnitutus sp.]|nr:carboxypeptidase regulatory-like domain-containing protein [Candidatus Didemnitutus sp.]
MRLFSAALLLLSVLTWSLRAEAGAVIEGTVTLPKPRAAPVVNKRYQIVAQAGGVLAPYPPVAVVWLEGSFPAPAVPAVAQVVQKDLVFVPALLPVQVGTRVEFPNLDDTYHNIFSYSATKRFDLGRYRPDERPVPSQVFETPGLVTLRCDIHEHMRGLILVLATPYFVVTDTDGHFRLTGLPAGHYVLKAWLDSKTVQEHPVELVDGETLSIDFP